MTADEIERRHQASMHAFAAGLAHKLGNLVQVISGNLELIGLRSSDESTLRYLANAREASDQLAELTRSLAIDPPAGKDRRG